MRSKDSGQRLVNGLCGSHFAALIALSTGYFWVGIINCWIIGAAALLGFALATLMGEEMVDFLKSMFWWT
jgi:hypothetical protein